MIEMLKRVIPVWEYSNLYSNDSHNSPAMTPILLFQTLIHWPWFLNLMFPSFFSSSSLGLPTSRVSLMLPTYTLTFISHAHLWNKPSLQLYSHPPPACNPPPALWSGPIRIQPERGLIMQAAVSPLRWGPPGDSSTASDWGCATESDSSTNNTEKRMLMDQIRWVLRWEGGGCVGGRGGR